HGQGQTQQGLMTRQFQQPDKHQDADHQRNACQHPALPATGITEKTESSTRIVDQKQIKARKHADSTGIVKAGITDELAHLIQQNHQQNQPEQCRLAAENFSDICGHDACCPCSRLKKVLAVSISRCICACSALTSS